MAGLTPGTPEWWLSRLYTKLRNRQPKITEWDNWYTGAHPDPKGYLDAEELIARVLETLGLNMTALVTDAALDRMQVTGFSVGGTSLDDIWAIWQANDFDLGSEQVRQEKMALSEAYVLVDPNKGDVRMTPEHPEQCIVEYEAGSTRDRAAGLKVWVDELGESGPQVWATVYLPNGIHTYAAPTRVWANETRSALAIKPAFELQPSRSGPHDLDEVPLVPFANRGRMLREPLPEFAPIIPIQRRINKTLMDRMAMQDQGAFKALWASGLAIPRDPVTKEPIESFVKAIDRLFVNENPAGKWGQLEAEDIKQMLDAVRDDVADCAMLVPTSADQILSKLVNVAADGLKLAQSSEIKRVRSHMKHESEQWEVVARLTAKAGGISVPNAERMQTDWRNPEYRTDTEQANAAVVALNAGMPHEAVWARYFNATPDEVRDWSTLLARRAASDPVAQALAEQVSGNSAAAGS